jgi:hypothetical protein
MAQEGCHIYQTPPLVYATALIRDVVAQSLIFFSLDILMSIEAFDIKIFRIFIKLSVASFTFVLSITVFHDWVAIKFESLRLFIFDFVSGFGGLFLFVFKFPMLKNIG